MSILTLDVGGSNLSVQCQRGGHAAPRRAGSTPIDADGGETSSIRAELMVVPVVLTLLTASDAADIRALFALGAQVDCQGDIFNNGNAVVTCSATFADDLRPIGTLWELSLTLYEIGTTLAAGGGSTTTPIYLGNGTSGGGSGGTFGASPDQSDIDPDGWAFYDVFPGVTAPSCSGPSACTVVFSGVVQSWTTPPLAATRIFGTPTIVQTMSGGTGDVWATQAVYLMMTVVRGGVDVATWSTNWSPTNGGFAGSDVTMTFGSSLLFQIEDGDILRFDEYARMGLQPGATDDGSSPHQAVGVGHLGGPTYLCIAYLGGTVRKLLP